MPERPASAPWELDETVDPLWAAAELPPALPLQGNLDPLTLIAGGAAMERAVKSILDAFADRPHIFNLGTESCRTHRLPMLNGC